LRVVLLLSIPGTLRRKNLFRSSLRLSKFFITCITIWINVREKRTTRFRHCRRKETLFSSCILSACYWALFLWFFGLL